MKQDHVTFELLQSVVAGECSLLELARRTTRHLAELCPTCREALGHEVLAVPVEPREEGEPRLERGSRHGQEGAYEDAYEEASEAAMLAQFRRRRPRRTAAPLLEALLRLSPEEQARCLGTAPEYAGNLSLVELLLAEAFDQLPAAPQAALGLARLAKMALQYAEASTLVADLYARAMAHTGNALRVLGQLPEAADHFDHARFWLRREGVVDRLTVAEIDRLESSLRRDQRRLPEAVELLSRALLAYRREGHSKQIAETLLKLDVVYREQGQFDRGIEKIQEALELIDGTEEPRLLLMARHNLAQRQVDHGDFAAAREMLVENARLYERFLDPPTQLRRLWLEGNIARGLDAPQTAETCYRAVREGWRRERNAFDMALVSLDLAGLYLAQGRTAEVKPLAEEMVTVFQDLGVHREAQTAALLFADAVRLEQVSAAYLQELARYLEVSRSNPALAFARAM